MTAPGCLRAASVPGKRERLVAAASQVLYEHGVEKSALADIAAAADVPLGNVYYYFRTKDALVSAVIDDYRQTFGELRAQLSRGEEPADRLKALLEALTERQERLLATAAGSAPSAASSPSAMTTCVARSAPSWSGSSTGLKSSSERWAGTTPGNWPPP